MKSLTFIIFFSISLFAQNYTYLIDEYDKVIDLEAKIVSKIAKDIIKNKPINLYIPNIEPKDKKVYSKELNVVETCDQANFVFVKYKNDKNICKDANNKYFFTSNYKKLLKNKKFIGAFFWSKSRPNIVFIKNRLDKNNILLSKEYNQFIEGN